MIALGIRDIWLAFRSGGSFALSLAFFLIVIMLVPFGVGNDPDLLAKIAPGILWIGAMLASLLSLDRLFQMDFEDGSLEVLATSPIPLEGVAAAKAGAHWITIGLPLTLATVPLGYLLNMPTEAYGWAIISIAIGTPALSFIGTFAAAITVGVKRGGLLLSLLVLPLYMPSLIFGAQIIDAALRDMDPTSLVLAHAGITLGAVATMPFAAAMALRANLR